MEKREPYPSELQERFIIRLPTGMRDRIRVAAEENGRSMNSEILTTLSEKYPETTLSEEVIRGFLNYLLDAQTSDEFEARKQEVNKNLVSLGSYAHVLEEPPAIGKVGIRRFNPHRD